MRNFYDSFQGHLYFFILWFKDKQFGPLKMTITRTLGLRDLFDCFVVHICVFILHIHHILHFCVPRPKFLEPKWSHK